MSTVEKKIDRLGRIVLPIEFREKLGLKNNSSVFVSLCENYISVFSRENKCALCENSFEGIRELRLCDSCIKKAKKIKTGE